MIKLGDDMMGENKDKEKKFSVIVSPKAKKCEKHTLFLIKTTEEKLQIQFADSTETKDEVIVTVKDNVSIPASQMKNFLVELLRALAKYEEVYKNGYGIEIDSSEDKIKTE